MKTRKQVGPGGWVGNEINARMENMSERNLATIEALNTKHQPITKSLETSANGVLQQNTKNIHC